jgi:hypothetical protein
MGMMGRFSNGTIYCTHRAVWRAATGVRQLQQQSTEPLQGFVLKAD